MKSSDICWAIVGIITGLIVLLTPDVGRATPPDPGWEQVSIAGPQMYRLRVPTGWIVRVDKEVCFVPDPQHGWGY